MGPETNSPTRLAIAQRFLTHIGHRDIEESVELLSPNATYRVPGNHTFAGVFSGRQEILDHLIRLFERTMGSFDAFKWEDWMVGEQHVAALVRIHIHQTGQMYRGLHVFLVRFDSDDKITEIIVFFEDESSVERFFGK